jgi:hypothetical protein
VGDGSCAEVEMVNGTITPEDMADAVAVCTSAAESSTYSLSNDQSLDLTKVLNDMSYNGIVKGVAKVRASGWLITGSKMSFRFICCWPTRSQPRIR